jgi:IEC3 subunit of the Ino80 complex, chromatin re-modelling
MSLEHLLAPAVEGHPTESDSKEHKSAPLRSWRKKYRKLKVRFNKVMDDSNAQFKEERRALALARRLQEENE